VKLWTARPLAWLCCLLIVIPPWQPSALNSPVTALALDGSGRLYIGQDATLSEAEAIGATITVSRSADLRRGTIRAILPTAAGIFIVSEDGLSLLDLNLNPLDFAAGGGQRVIAIGNRVYVAALAAGVRVYEVANGRLIALGRVQTGGAAEDIGGINNDTVWVAERDQGFRLYDLRNPNQPIVTLWAKELAPARRLLLSQNRLLAGYANKVALLDVSDLRAPRLLNEVTLGEPTAHAGTLVLETDTSGTRAVIGRVAQGGADFIVYDTANLSTLAELARYGEGGAGEHLALRATDIFTGSERYGLRWLQRRDRAVQVIAEYAADLERIPCGDKTPVNPQPANLSIVPKTAQLTLRWGAECRSRAYLLKIDGQPDRQLTTTEFTLENPPELLRWQVIALDGAQGELQIAGERWQVELERGGLIAPPSPLPAENTLYVAPVTAFLDTPGGVLITTCAALLIGLGVIVGGAYLIGVWAERRRDDLPL
jgi:hypothetical protein